jgi:HEPN domain-containing protein
MPKRYPPDGSQREWLNRARSNLARSRAKRKGIYLEDLCFDAQQATEKAIKALLIKLDVDFSYVHDLAELLTLVEKAGQEVPESIRQAEPLSKFAVFTRYPGIGPSIKEKEYRETVEIAARVIKWAENIISAKRRK